MPLNSIRRLLHSQKGMKSRYQAGNKRQPGKMLEEGIAIHIISTSATMVGVCFTVIGIFKVIFQDYLRLYLRRVVWNSTS
jgi:hypothetical protein